ncbi:MAG: hypothetical protein JWM68_3357, partial [Verrucomicrobiales bacterium]|nr:hypothetical protein [Verrucomicrobiales bacterium]
YTHTGARMERRSAGEEERVPVGLAALPQVVLPNMYGSTQQGSLALFPEGQPSLQESTATTYAGVFATLLLAPLAWCSRRHRSINLFWAFLAFFALSWSLNVPGLVAILRLPGLNMMSHNRFVFAASFAILAMTAVGLEVLWQKRVERRWWFWLPTALLAVLCAWSFYRFNVLPEVITTALEQDIKNGKQVASIHGMEGVRQVQAWFTRSYLAATILCGLGVVGWLLLWFRKTWRPWTVPVLGLFMLGDLLWFAHDRSAQCDPALYYPRIPALVQISKSTPGRIVGYNCLMAPLGRSHGLHDIRGYDAVDPARLLDLLSIAAAPSASSPTYALTQSFVPQVSLAPPDGIRFSPILDMLGVRYLISRQAPLPPFRADFHSDDYWVSVNQFALPRAFVPRHIESVADDEQFKKLSSPQFDPREMAYVESPVVLPATCSGDATIVSEIPTRITVALKMETPGLVVLADLWDKGWSAYIDGKPAPILLTNHAIRGVVVPAGTATLEFRYEPASLTLGLWLTVLALVILSLWTGLSAWREDRASKPA